MRVFISYSRDDKHWVNEFWRAMYSELHYDAWIDRRLVPAQDWWMSILENIENSDCFVTILSPKAIESIYCQAELKYALALKKPVLPLMLKDCDYPAELQILRIQYLPISEEMNMERVLLKVSVAFSEIRVQLLAKPFEPVEKITRPSLPEPEKKAEHIFEVFMLAEEAANENSFAFAEKLYKQVINADPNGWGIAAAKRLSEVKFEHERGKDYLAIVHMMSNPLLVKGALASIPVFILKYGKEYDPAGVIGDAIQKMSINIDLSIDPVVNNIRDAKTSLENISEVSSGDKKVVHDRIIIDAKIPDLSRLVTISASNLTMLNKVAQLEVDDPIQVIFSHDMSKFAIRKLRGVEIRLSSSCEKIWDTDISANDIAFTMDNVLTLVGADKGKNLWVKREDKIVMELDLPSTPTGWRDMRMMFDPEAEGGEFANVIWSKLTANGEFLVTSVQMRTPYHIQDYSWDAQLFFKLPSNEPIAKAFGPVASYPDMTSDGSLIGAYYYTLVDGGDTWEHAQHCIIVQGVDAKDRSAYTKDLTRWSDDDLVKLLKISPDKSSVSYVETANSRNINIWNFRVNKEEKIELDNDIVNLMYISSDLLLTYHSNGDAQFWSIPDKQMTYKETMENPSSVSPDFKLITTIDKNIVSFWGIQIS